MSTAQQRHFGGTSKLWVLDCEDDDGGLSIGVYSSKTRALAALRHAVGKDRFSRFEREDSDFNPDHHVFFDPEAEADRTDTHYRITAFGLDRHA